MSMKKIWTRIGEVNKIDNATSERLVLKAVEELGEYAETLHWESGYKKTDKSKKEIKEDQLQEGVDVIICILASLDKQGNSYKDIKKMFNKKITKWAKKYDGTEV